MLSLISEIDFDALQSAVSNSDANASAITSLRHASHVAGVFYLQLKRFGIKVEKCALEHARTFFDLPYTEKAKLCNINSPQFRGYIAHGQEVTRGKADMREQMEFGVEMPSIVVTEGDELWKRLIGPNLWPDIPYFRDDFEYIIKKLEHVSETLMRAFALALRMPVTALRTLVVHFQILSGRLRTTKGKSGVGPILTRVSFPCYFKTMQM